ncbi:excinuclease ABC subunit UvrC [Oceanibacterium hippocampi]|uniref:UvrABC system protein C n=1 Tax=Oceanibacterium hippocampi TaxID=745714 RepID=A0A1Y5TVP3_9PROT|nr:excinuclease ABC subunit UvrC [Oceanibacterium hippocampi]SLN74424.1 UvrABC system protein C [Oceanibacterium hippocampi]
MAKSEEVSERATGTGAPEAPAPIGAEVIRKALRTLPSGPGVYRMLDRQGSPLYVGKAKNLKKRVASYVKPTGQSTRILRMVAMTHALEIISTGTEVEALLLEANLIKKLKPRYNIVLRDDKSFPYILLRGDHDWPQIAKHRGARSREGEYFGPFASAGAVNQTIGALQRAFPLRSCSDSDFESRTRPCLQYQIKRCTAPCVDRIDRAGYLAIVDDVRDFLSGRSSDLQKSLSAKMEKAAEALDFETATVYRDRLRALSHILSRQGINLAGVGEADVFAAFQEGGATCIQVFFFRAGQNFGNRAYYPSHDSEHDAAAVLGAFVGQFYDDRPAPKLILTSEALAEAELIGEALSTRTGRKVTVTAPQRGVKREAVEHALVNAREALARKLSDQATQTRLLARVGEIFGLDAPPSRIEVYDNSHISGENAVGAMIVAGPDGLQKAAYRKFNIKSTTLTPGDDYGMMREVLARRLARIAKDPAESSDTSAIRPDLLLIDGGKGQLSAALETLRELGVEDIPLASIAKGPDRDAGRERFFIPGREPFSLRDRDPALYFLQRLRDEAHRFAIGAHRTRRSKAIQRSPLDEIPGIGPRRKKALLTHFGSARDIAGASLADLEKVEGVSTTMARTIHDHFRGD